MKNPDKFKKITSVRLPFDRRHENDSMNYGIHCLDLWFVLKGPLGAVQYAVSMPIYLPHVDVEYRAKYDDWDSRKKIRGFDVGYHSPKPMYEGQTAMSGECEYLEGGKCYYDGSSLASDRYTKNIFATTGEPPENVLWRMLEEEYEMRFKS